MKYDDLWNFPSSDKDLNLTVNIIKIMDEQGQYLKEHTNGKITWNFSVIKKLSPFSIPDEIETAYSLNDFFQNNIYDSRSDASGFYTDQKYYFEIYNKTHKFRIFELLLSPIYPVSIFIDDGIIENIKGEIGAFTEKGKAFDQYIINNDEDFIGCLRLIFSSKKLRYILYRLQQGE